MAIPVSSPVSGVMLATLIAVALGGCSINLGSLSEPDKTAPLKTTAAGDINPPVDRSETDVGQSQAAAARGQALMRSGKDAEALREFEAALTFDPHNAQAFYSRGLLYQSQQQHPPAIDDFTAANGLTPRRAEPLLGRAISYLALNKVKEAADDLDEAAQDDPQNAEIWVSRGLAYERLGDKVKAAESYGHALTLRPRDETARAGFARVGKAG